MIDLNKLHTKHIEALLEANRHLPASVTKFIIFENNHFQAGLKSQEYYRHDQHEYDKRARSILKFILDAKKQLFHDKSNKTLFFTPKGKKALMAAYDETAKKAIKNNGEFTRETKNGPISSEDLKRVFDGNIDASRDLDTVVLQSMELAYIKGEQFPKVLVERMQELGMVDKKQTRQVTEIIKNYEKAAKAEQAKPKPSATTTDGQDNGDEFEHYWRNKFKPESDTDMSPVRERIPPHEATKQYDDYHDEMQKQHEQRAEEITRQRSQQQAMDGHLAFEQHLRDVEQMQHMHSPSNFEEFIRESWPVQHTDRLHKEREIGHDDGFER